MIKRFAVGIVGFSAVIFLCQAESQNSHSSGHDHGFSHSRGLDHNFAITANAIDLLHDGRRIFRYDTFGNEAFWSTPCNCIGRLRGRSSGVSALGSVREPHWLWD
jgi:hypothetical protein